MVGDRKRLCAFCGTAPFRPILAHELDNAVPHLEKLLVELAKLLVIECVLGFQLGCAFQPVTVPSSQAMISAAVCGCWPARARRTMIRWTDSAMLSQEPDSGVYKGSTP